MKFFFIPLFIIGILSLAGYIVYDRAFSSAVVTTDVALVVRTKAEPSEVREGEQSTISWSSAGATGCYLSSPSERRNEIGIYGSSSGPIYGKFLPAKITCYNKNGNEASEDLVLTIKQ